MKALPSFVKSWKTISFSPRWSEPEPETGYCWFLAPLEINGVSELGLGLKGGCYYDRPDTHVTFELEVGRVMGVRRTPLARVDWRSLADGHSNRRGCPNAQATPRTSDTHIHSFELNWISNLSRMRHVNLPCADDVEENLESFEDLKAYVGKKFKINNIGVVKEPNWVYRLI